MTPRVRKSDAATIEGRLRKAEDLDDSLRALLTMKTRAGYSHERVSANERKRAGRAAERLLTAARARRMTGSSS